ncbi:hypothetical protein AMS68_006769 [Peltaster fructicola]|uniref:RNA-binding S4 domain-containing protein n=1 Tax=Peltaster fructicola TaxID=286661 RepID=A0A6H0Y2K4_9PEZI|nr:hypothetical protein AMS68_006769 [Peltaster fructicola]
MPRNYRNLKRPKIRPDWNKYTLFNLSRLTRSTPGQLTFFQQKWRAKSALRGYHSPYVREGYWERMFDRRLPGVVPMDYRYLARFDGSELAAGRGAGLVTEQDGVITEQQGQTGKRKLPRTPYMSMAFFPLERRLDTAIWRALFASSTRQARQMVAHGSVKVNGKKMIYPGYLLNPGDMFSIDPDKVLYATGARKKTKDSHKAWNDREFQLQHPLAATKSKHTSGEQRRNMSSDAKEKQEEASSEDATDETAKARKEFKSLRDRAKEILKEGKADISGKRLIALRQFAKSVQSAMSKFGRKSEDATQAKETVEDFEKVFTELAAGVPDEALPTAEAAQRSAAKDEADLSEMDARKDAELLAAALERARENPIDSSKPYATPWRPRPYMSAFAFIPRYLEVNQNICSAVYIRHPVARPGLSEVPSPFDYETSQLGFNWYLRRR